jgi:hypothetical protein
MLKIFLNDTEIVDTEIIKKLITPLRIREDYEVIPDHIKYSVKISNFDYSQYIVNYFTYGNKLQHFMKINKKDIFFIIREMTLNKILNGQE